MRGTTLQDRIRIENYRVNNKNENERLVLGQFGHVRRRPINATVRKGDSLEIVDTSRGRGRPKRLEQKELNITLRYLI